MKLLSCLLFLVVLAGCAAPRPVIYPNERMRAVGPTQMQRDIAECRWLADNYVRSDPVGETAKSTVLGAGIGAALGAVGGAVTGDPATGAAVGAATGSAGGFLRGLFKGSQPDPLYKGYVNRCLEERGYDVVGWQ